MTKRHWPLVAFLLLALLYTLPLARQWATHIPGDNGDSVPNLWSFWYFPRAITTELATLFHTTLQFYPDGVSLVYTSNSAIGAVLMAPISLLISPTAALNSWLILHLWLGGWFFFRFCKVLGAGTAGAFLGGVAYMCSPFIAAHLPGHYTLVQIGYTAGALYSLAELARRCVTGETSCWRRWMAPSIGLGLCVWAVAATDFYLAVMTVMLLLPAAVAHVFLVHGRSLFMSSSFWKGFMLAVAVAALMLIPWVGLIISAREGHDYAPLATRGYSNLVAHWFRLVSLPKYHPVWGPLLYAGEKSYLSVFNEYTYLGIVGLFLAFTGMLRMREPRRMAAWIVAFVIALGLSGANSYTDQPAWAGTPLAFGKWWPASFPFSEFRVPSRWQFALCAVLAVGVALGSDALLARLRRAWQVPVAILFFALLAFDLVRWPLPTFPAQPVASALTAAARVTPGTALDVPIGVLSGQGHSLGQYKKETFLRQMSHGMPVLTAYVARLPGDLIEKRRSDRELTVFLAVQDSAGETSVPANLDWPGFQKRYNITAVRIPKDWPTSTSLVKLSDQLNPNWRWKEDADSIVAF